MRVRGELVGRDEELGLLRAALADGDARGAVLSGPPGVGKTRLATEFLEHARTQEWATEWAVGTRAMASVPFGAVSHLLAPTDATASSASELIRSPAEQLRRHGLGRRLVLGVDDAHLLDDASAGLTRRLAASGGAFVVATVRRGEPTPDAIRSLCADELVGQIELQPLARTEIIRLLATVLGGHVDSTTAHRLWSASGGNVLFLRELVVVGLDRAALAERDGVWSWSGELAGGDRLAELIEDRFAGLTQQQRAAVEVLAVGEPLPTALLAAILGRHVVHQLDVAGLVTVTEDGQRSSVALAHPLYADTLRAGLGSLRRQQICRKLAETLAGTGARRREDVVRLSLWRLDSGERTDPSELVIAARQARSVFDHQLVERLARAALVEGGGAVAGLLLGDALHWQGDYRQARTVLEGHPPDRADSDLVAEWAVVNSTNYFWGLGDAERAERTVLAVERRIGPGSHREGLIAHRATMAFFNGRLTDALAAVEPLLDRAQLRGAARARCCTAAVLARAATGRCDPALQAAAEGVTIASMLGEARRALLGELLAAQAIALLFGGRVAEMEELAAGVYQHIVPEWRHDRRGLWALLLGRAALAAGRAGTAHARLREAVTLLREQDIGLLSWALSSLARAAALLGDLDGAAQALAEHDRRRLPAVRVFDGDAVLDRAWVAAASGEHTAARRLARQAADHAADAGQRSLELESLHDATRLGEPRLHRRLATLAGCIDNVLAPAFAAHAAALATGDGPALDRCAERFAELGTPLLAAEAAAEAADAHHRMGRVAARQHAQQRSWAWSARCEGASTPALRRSAPSQLGLTTREREIAELAVRGLSKREIAGRLMLSVRTVGNHLNHVYAKLGVTTRRELVALGPTGERPAP